MNMYNNGFPVTYVSPYQQAQYQSVQQPIVQQPQPQNNAIVWVQGEAGAKSYLVGAGQSVILMDSEDQFFYIKTADQSGMPILRKFRFEEVTNQQMTQPKQETVNDNYITREEFEKRISELKKTPNNNRRENRQDGKSNS